MNVDKPASKLQTLHKLLNEPFQENGLRINQIVKSCGVISGASMAIYQTFDNENFVTKGQWQIPEGLDLNSGSFCQLVNDTVKNKENQPYLFVGLFEDIHATIPDSGPLFNYGAYLGYPVFNSHGLLGVLSLLFAQKPDFQEQDHVLLRLLVQSLSYEETIENLQNRNEELVRINKEKDNFYSIIAHDLKSPFNGFLGLTYLLTDELGNLNSDELFEITSTLRKSANNMYALLENLLEWSRIQREVIKFDPQPMALIDHIYRTIQFVAESAQKKQILINPNVSESIIVNSDPHMTLTILKNLIFNSIKYSHPGREVKIYTLRNTDSMVEIIVRDHGVGISEEILKNLFNINELIKKPGTDGESGSGLGLMICKNYIEKHHGSIRIIQNVEGGISVHFTLPTG